MKVNAKDYPYMLSLLILKDVLMNRISADGYTYHVLSHSNVDARVALHWKNNLVVISGNPTVKDCEIDCTRVCEKEAKEFFDAVVNKVMCTFAACKINDTSRLASTGNMVAAMLGEEAL